MIANALKSDEFFKIVDQEDATYPDACEFVAKQYRERLKCELKEFYPHIACLSDPSGIIATAGLRYSEDNSREDNYPEDNQDDNQALNQEKGFFLEQYLTESIETLVGDQRDAIVEIGGFAALRKLDALILMQQLAETLDSAGIRHVVCTANRPLRGCLRKLGINFKQLGVADEQSLTNRKDHWGAYYKTTPLVLTGEVTAGVKSIQSLMAFAQ